jgi:hypothetical protein
MTTDWVSWSEWGGKKKNPAPGSNKISASNDYKNCQFLKFKIHYTFYKPTHFHSSVGRLYNSKQSTRNYWPSVSYTHILRPRETSLLITSYTHHVKSCNNLLTINFIFYLKYTRQKLGTLCQCCETKSLNMVNTRHNSTEGKVSIME